MRPPWPPGDSASLSLATPPRIGHRSPLGGARGLLSRPSPLPTDRSVTRLPMMPAMRQGRTALVDRSSPDRRRPGLGTTSRRSSEPRKWTRRPAEGVKWGAAMSDTSGAPLSISTSARHSTARTVGFVLGVSVTTVGLAMLIPAAVSFLTGEPETAVGILGAAAISVAAGSLAAMTSGRPSSIGMKDGFAAVGLTWFALTAAGALPYLMTGTIPGLADAIFETASGFTTTGASILPDPSALPTGIALWRGLTQWLGGMGVIVLSVAILPVLGVGGVQLARAESPGVAPERITPRF